MEKRTPSENSTDPFHWNVEGVQYSSPRSLFFYIGMQSGHEIIITDSVDGVDGVDQATQPSFIPGPVDGMDQPPKHPLFGALS